MSLSHKLDNTVTAEILGPGCWIFVCPLMLVRAIHLPKMSKIYLTVLELGPDNMCGNWDFTWRHAASSSREPTSNSARIFDPNLLTSCYCCSAVCCNPWATCFKGNSNILNQTLPQAQFKPLEVKRFRFIVMLSRRRCRHIKGNDLFIKCFYGMLSRLMMLYGIIAFPPNIPSWIGAWYIIADHG